MIETRKRAYLEAMGFDVWLAKPPERARDRLVVGPGQGSTLVVCEEPGQAGTKLAGDIVRALGGDPVWAWPDPEGDPGQPKLPEAVADGLFTRVVVFGETVAADLLGPRPPDVLGSSAVIVTTGLDELASRGSSKQSLWLQLRRGTARQPT